MLLTGQNNDSDKNMTAPWQNTFRAFAGPGIERSSDSLRVSDDEAEAILADLAPLTWSPPDYVGSERHRDYSICHARETCATALFGVDGIVGFYAGSYLWIARAHRGIGLSTPLILAAAEQRGGTVLPPGVVVQGYSPTGLAAHWAAHHHAIRTALAAGRPVPMSVTAELRRDARSGHSNAPSRRNANQPNVP